MNPKEGESSYTIHSIENEEDDCGEEIKIEDLTWFTLTRSNLDENQVDTMKDKE